MSNETRPRSFDEWFQRAWKEIVGVPTPPQLVEFKSRWWLALKEKEELACPFCGRKFPGDIVPYSDVIAHGYKCKQNPTRDVARLLAELWNATIAARQQPGHAQVGLRHFESLIAPLLSRWGFGAAQATVPERPATAKIEIVGTIDPETIIGVFVCDEQGTVIETLGRGEFREVGRTFWARPGQRVTVRIVECSEATRFERTFFEHTVTAPQPVTYVRAAERNYSSP